MPRGQPRVVLFVEPVLRTVVVSLQLARGPRAVFDFATRMSERTIRQHRCEKRSLNFTKIRYRRKTFQPNNRSYRLTKNGYKIIRKERLNQCFYIKPRRSSLYSLSMAQASTLIFISIGDTKDIFCFILQSVDSVQELVCFCCLFKFYRVRLVRIIICSTHVYLRFPQTFLLQLMKILKLTLL